MSLWARTQQLPAEKFRQVRALYQGDYPIEVRHYLAEWIENRCWDELKPSNPEQELTASRTVSAAVDELDACVRALNSPDQFLSRIKLDEVLDNFKKAFLSNPVEFVNLVKSNLAVEYQLVQEADSALHHSLIMDERVSMVNAGILRELEQIRNRTQLENESISSLSQSQESVALMLHQYNQLVAAWDNLVAHQPHMFAANASSVNQEIVRNLEEQKSSVYDGLSKKVTEVLMMRRESAENLSHSISRISALQMKVLGEELPKWKRTQQLSLNGSSPPTHLDQIQHWCEGLAEVIWLNRNQVKELVHLQALMNVQESPAQDGVNGTGQQPKQEIDLGALMSQVTDLLQQIVSMTFLVEVQPPQVMKMNTRFTASVRHIVGGKLNIHMSAPKVRVNIVNEHEASVLRRRIGGPWTEYSGEILNNTGTLEYHQASKHLSVAFRNMQLKKIKRGDKKFNEANVTEEKYALLFQTEFALGDEQLYFQIAALSLPVVVTVHGNQDSMAWASICWDNAFCPVDACSPALDASAVHGSPCVHSSAPVVKWSQLKDLLRAKFSQTLTGNDGIGSSFSGYLLLNDDHLEFLGSKLKQLLSPVDQDFDVSWSSFCKDSLPGRNFSFWDWFFAAKRLVRDYLRDVWSAGCVMGFVSRSKAEDMLLGCPHGTFLLRFSDSELGGLTVAWIAEDSSTGKKEVFMLQPFVARDLNIRSLPDRISDLKYLANLYPAISKDDAFGKFYSPPDLKPRRESNGYVKPNLVTQVPGWTELSTSTVISDGFTPNTPHSMPELGESSFIPNGTSCEFLHMNHRRDVISQFDPRHAVMSLGLDTSVALPLEFNPRLGFDGLSALVNAATSSSGLVVANCLRGSTENLYLPVTDFADCDMTDDKSSHRVGFDVQ